MILLRLWPCDQSYSIWRWASCIGVSSCFTTFEHSLEKGRTPATDKHHDNTPIKTAAMLTLNTPNRVKCILTPSSNKHTLTVIEQSHSSVTICVFDILGEGNMSGSSNWVSLSLPMMLLIMRYEGRWLRELQSSNHTHLTLQKMYLQYMWETVTSSDHGNGPIRTRDIFMIRHYWSCGTHIMDIKGNTGVPLPDT